MTLAEAVARLESMGILLPEPQLPLQVVEDILARSARSGIRANSTAYSYGDTVIPATANGRVYECVTAGTSASTAPAFPAFGYQRLGQQIVDGTVKWRDVGAAHAERYDINAAARECWLWRAQQLSSKFDYSADGQSMNRSQLYDHAIAQARRYGWRGAL